MKAYNFFDLMNEFNTSEEDAEKLISDFFRYENLEDYFIPEDTNAQEREAINIMFDDSKDIYDRIDEARKLDEFCLEAFYVELNLRKDLSPYTLFMSYYQKINQFNSLTSGAKGNFLIILDLFIEYLIDIHNISKAIVIQKELLEITNNNKKRNITRLSYLYFLLEKHEEFYEFYENNEFDEAIPYLLLINTLLKNDEFEKAKIVLNDMVAFIPFSKYIYRLWELDDKTEADALDFKEAVESCYEELFSYPNFFSWCKENIEEVYKS